MHKLVLSTQFNRLDIDVLYRKEQNMKYVHEAVSLKFCCGSAGSVPAPKSVASWMLCRGLGKTLDEMAVTIPHDLYVFGSQENSVCDREWVESLRVALKEQTELDYKPVRKDDEC